MIIICSIRDTGHINADEKYAIVRSMKAPVKGVIQLPVLSPSSSLFFKYRELIKNGQWGPETFRSIYVPQFLEEMHSA